MPQFLVCKQQDSMECGPACMRMQKELEELAASLDENDNPVLMLVKLKE